MHADLTDRASLTLAMSSDSAKAMKLIMELLADCVKQGARFYLPHGGGILDGRVIDEEIKSIAKLPYECICILSQQLMGDDYDNVSPNGWGITVAFDPNSPFARDAFSTEFRDALHVTDRGFMVFSAIKTDDRDKWIPMPSFAFCDLATVGNGYAVRAGLPPGFSKDGTIDASKECADDISKVLNLCVMLSLHNVHAENIEPPERLNRKRIHANKLPLYSYHVLKVDGVLWDSDRNADTDEESTGIRSHLRRGHIRRLTEPERKIWVRPAIVHGKRKGFVHKDYHVATSTQEST